MYILKATCSSPEMKIFLYPIKNIMNAIMIVAPILLIIALSVTFTKGVLNGEDKKLTKGMFNAIVATIFVFLCSTIVSLTMKIAGDSFNVSACWNSATKPKDSSSYQEPTTDKKKAKGRMSNKTLKANADRQSAKAEKYYPDYSGSGGSNAIAEMAKNTAWSLGVTDPKQTYKSKPTDAYKRINDQYIIPTISKDQRKYDYAKGKSCCVFVAAVVRASYDTNYKFCADKAYDYMSKSSKWEKIDKSKAVAGDIFVKDNKGHILIYGGKANGSKNYIWYQANQSSDYGYAFFGPAPANKSGYSAWHATK